MCWHRWACPLTTPQCTTYFQSAMMSSSVGQTVHVHVVASTELNPLTSSSLSLILLSLTLFCIPSIAENFKRVLSSTTLHCSIPFDFNTSFVKQYFGVKHSHALDYFEFTQLLQVHACTCTAPIKNKTKKLHHGKAVGLAFSWYNVCPQQFFAYTSQSAIVAGTPLWCS